jgi:hypothetical protein
MELREARQSEALTAEIAYLIHLPEAEREERDDEHDIAA